MPIGGIGHDAHGDFYELFFESINDVWMLFGNVDGLLKVVVEVVEFESSEATRFDSGDPRLLESIECLVFIAEFLGFFVLKFTVENLVA